MVDSGQLKLSRSAALSLSSDAHYVLKLAYSHERNGILAAAVSESNEVKLYDRETFCTLGSLKGHEKVISGISFVPGSSHHHLWSSSYDGTVRLWDCRLKHQNSSVITFKGHHAEGFACLNVNCSGSIVCAGTGTENPGEDVYLYVWDPRLAATKDGGNAELAKFENCHSNDICDVKFHPFEANKLATGSTDGLISVLDLTSMNEADALNLTLNTESSVSSIGFFGPKAEYLYAITHVETAQFWDYLEGDLLGCFNGFLNEDAKCGVTVSDYLVDFVYVPTTEKLFLVAGNEKGHVKIFNSTIDSVNHIQTLQGGHHGTVRCLHYSQEDQTLITGAEDGMLSCWSADDTKSDVKTTKGESSSIGKISKKDKKKKSKRKDLS